MSSRNATHTQTHTHTNTQTHKHTNTHTNTHQHTLSHTQQIKEPSKEEELEGCQVSAYNAERRVDLVRDCEREHASLLQELSQHWSVQKQDANRRRAVEKEASFQV
jgi:hypothetical protein